MSFVSVHVGLFNYYDKCIKLNTLQIKVADISWTF